MKVALVHDYLNDFGGAERVLLALSEIYPDAPIYTIYYKNDSPCSKYFANKKIIQSWFAKLPFADKLISPLRFLLPFIWGNFDFSKYDLVITSAAWAVTKGVHKGPNTIEVCYLHTPPRYLYGYDTIHKLGLFAKIYAKLINGFMRKYDYKSAQKVNYFIVNSENVGKRIEKFYGKKDYKVIYPPVDINSQDKNFLLRRPHNGVASRKFSNHGEYFLTGGRLVSAKNFDLIIKAFNKNGKKLTVFGEGPERDYLHSIAKSNIEFVGRVSDEELNNLYQNATAFIVAQKDEDFGITPIEAASHGCPTIAYKAEGYLETVVENKTGLFFDKLTTKSLNKAIKKAGKIKWDKRILRSHAEKFSKERFKKEVGNFINSI